MAVDTTTQAIARRYTKPFGETRGATPTSWPDDKGFLGKPMDSDTGLTHIGAREYDPAAGRFLSVDPVLVPEDHESMNGYAYADNTPVTESDPTGLRPITACEQGCSDGKGGSYRDYMSPGANGTWIYNTTEHYTVKAPGTSDTYISATVRTRAGRTTSVGITVFKKPSFKKGPNPEPERKDGKKGEVMDLSGQELALIFAKGGPPDVTLPPDGKFVRQLRTEDHYRSFIRKMQGMIKDGIYRTGKESFDKKHGDRTAGEMTYEQLLDAAGILTEGIYGSSPTSFVLGSYNLDYQLLGVSCEPPKTDSEWDHGALVGQVQVSIRNDMTKESARRSPTPDGYKNGSPGSISSIPSRLASQVWPDGQTKVSMHINFIEEVYVPF